MKDPNRFYVYTYLDPRKPGQYSYGDYCFLYEPFYVGKGCGKRATMHLFYANNPQFCYNTFMANKINKIRRVSNRDPYIIKIEEGMLETAAFALEARLISNIGLTTEKNGTLANLKYGGFGGVTHTQVSKDNMKFRMSLVGMIDKHGVDEGTRKWNARTARIAITSKEIWERGESGLSKFLGEGGNPNTPELLAKRIATTTGRKMSQQYCDNCRSRVPKGRDHEWTGKYIFNDPMNREYLALDGMFKFCNEHAISIGAMKGILHGKLVRGHYRGWTVRYASTEDIDNFKGKSNPEVDPNLKPLVLTGINPGTKNYVIADPNGMKYYWVTDMPKFCRKYNIPLTAMRKLVQGRSTTGNYKGWTARYATLEDTQNF